MSILKESAGTKDSNANTPFSSKKLTRVLFVDSFDAHDDKDL